jgi:hypothetical protein
MKKYFVILLSVSLTWSVSAKELSKEDKKRINSQLKEYKKDPESFQRMLDRNKDAVDSATAQLSEKRAELKEMSNNLANAQNKVTSLEGELKECKSKPEQVCPPCPTPGAVPMGGSVYKIQLGLFKNVDLGSFLDHPKYFGIEKVGDKNRYVISYFDTKDDAEKFVAELKKLGIKGAFASIYEGGERVIEEKTKKPAGKPAPKKAPAKKGK